MSEIVMPRLSDTMEEGTILRWLKADGEHVARGEELVEIETDKATMAYESDQDGVLRIVAAEGATLPVGAPIAGVEANGRGGESAPPAAPERVKASPLARRIARERGVDLSGVSGSGPGGRVVKADVLGAQASAGTPAAAPAQEPRPSAQEPPARARIGDVATAKGATTEVELSRAQQTIARRMAESKATIPHFSLQCDVDMEACVMLRGELKPLAESAAGAAGHLAAPTYNDMVVKASALALREHPRANGSYRDGRLLLHSRVNVGVAVAAHDALVVPTVFDADAKALGEIARETRELAQRVRERTVTPPELGGGTFTVSNLGMYGVRSFHAIINPPQAAILSVGALQPRAVAREGKVVVRSTLTLTLACDHRILYGADAAEFLARIRELLESPSALTL